MAINWFVFLAKRVWFEDVSRRKKVIFNKKKNISNSIWPFFCMASCNSSDFKYSLKKRLMHRHHRMQCRRKIINFSSLQIFIEQTEYLSRIFKSFIFQTHRETLYHYFTSTSLIIGSDYYKLNNLQMVSSLNWNRW